MSRPGDVDYVQAELRAVTQRYQRAWGSQPPKTGALHWRNAWDRLEQMRDPAVAAPQGPLAVIDGAGTRQSGLFSRDPGAPEIASLHVERVTGYGVAQMAWNGQAVPSTGRAHIHDCAVDGVAASPPRSMDGTGEAGFWFGQRVLAERLIARDCAWMGLWTGAAFDGSTVQDFDLLDMPHVAIYPEHNSTNALFQRFRADLRDGADGNVVNVEWSYGGGGSHDLTWLDFDIYVPAGCWAFFLDAGTYGCRIMRGRIWGPGNGIAVPANLVDSSRPNLIDLSSIDMTNLAGAKVTVHQNKIGSAKPQLTVYDGGTLEPGTVRMPAPIHARLGRVVA